MKLVPFLSFLNQIKVYHWQTFSYAQHKALNKAYQNLDDQFDLFVETYYGKYGKSLENKVYHFEIDSLTDQENVKKIISNKKRELISYLRTEVCSQEDQDLLNIVADIEIELNHLQYFLDLK